MRKNILNLCILLLTILLPFKIFDYYQNDSRYIDSIQIPVFFIVFVGSALLVYINHKNQKQAQKNRWWWILFEIIGVIGVLYSGFVLSLLLMFHNCCGF